MITVRTLYKQELLLILMQQSIPIIVTGNSHNNINTFTKRTRRISSSAAAKRFPKDFFKDQHCLHPKKINRPDNKQYQQFLFDTFSTKKFIAGNIEMQKTRQIRNESGSDTPKFKQRSSTIQHVNINKTSSNKCRKVKQKIQDSFDSPLIDKYNTISPQIERNDMIQKREVQKQQKQQKNIPFTSIPFISNFNITLGQKLNMVNLINKKVAKNTKTKQIDEKQNHLVMIPCLSARRQKNNTKNEGFRIRKKLIN